MISREGPRGGGVDWTPLDILAVVDDFRGQQQYAHIFGRGFALPSPLASLATSPSNVALPGRPMLDRTRGIRRLNIGDTTVSVTDR